MAAQKRTPKTKNLKGLSNKYKLLSVAIIGVLFGIVGTLSVKGSFAAKPAPYLIPNSNNQYTSQPWNPVSMGYSVTFKPVYKTNLKNPIGKITCWHLDSVPSYWPDQLTGVSVPSTSPIFTQTVSPLPASLQEFQVKLGDSNTGPAICQSQFFEGSNLMSTITFGTL